MQRYVPRRDLALNAGKAELNHFLMMCRVVKLLKHKYGLHVAASSHWTKMKQNITPINYAVQQQHDGRARGRRSSHQTQ